MRRIKNAAILGIVVCALSTPAFCAERAGGRGKIVSHGEDGSVCYESDVREDEEFVRKTEAAEKAGKLKKAFDAASGVSPGCLPENGYERLFSVIERTYKKLGQEAERAGRFYEAHKYYVYPFEHFFAPGSFREREKYYSFDDADRAMLSYARAGQDDYKVVERAVRYSEARNGKPNLKEVRGLAVRGGDRLLAKEEKAFAERRYKDALDILRESGRWFNMADDERKVNERAGKRADSLLKEGSYDSIERALDYCDVTLMGNAYAQKRDKARALAGKLGNEAEQSGDYAMAERYYSLSGDDSRRDAMGRKIDAIETHKEKKKTEAEGKRQGQFKKEQDALEKELGF
ncbi:MAG: hypothetical protein Q8P48_06910 [Deltaproteobacteria bacterium]|nr:hypothetical protein [Deltaproteobacteria bacterium]